MFSEDGGIERGAEVVSLRSEFSRTFATSVAGVFETVSSSAPLHFEGADGGWRRFDNDLESASGDVVAPAATDVPVAIASDASAAELVAVEPAEGVSVGFGLEGAAAVEAEVAGDTATFSEVVEGVDVELTALDRGVKETIVLASPESPSEFRFPLVLEGASASVNAEGAVEYRDGTGAVVAVTPAGFMVDSATARGVGERSEAVTYAVEDDGSGPVLVVSVDPGWLADPARVFPVLVDPTVEPPFATVEVGADDTYVADSDTGDHSTNNSLYVGYGDGAVLRSYLQFPGMDDFDGMNVYDARLDLRQVFGTNCSPGPVEAYPVPTAWEGSEVTSWPGPVEDLVDRVAIDSMSGTAGFGAPGCSSPGAVSIHLTAGAARWTSTNPNESWANNGVMLRAADESQSAGGFREFASADSSTPPTLNLIWSDPSDAGEDNTAPTVSGPYAPQGDLASTAVTASAVYDDTDEDRGHVTYFSYFPDTYLLSVITAPEVDPGETSGFSATVPWDVRFSWRASAVEDDVDAPGLPHSPLTPFIEFEARSVQLTDPVPDQVLFDDVTVTATAAVTTNLTGVQFLLDGNVVFTDTAAPFEMAGSSTTTADGPHTLAARAVYSSGPPRTSVTIDVTVDNGLNTQQRLQVDLGTGRIDLDEFTEYGVKGLLNQDAIEPRYRSTAEASIDPTAGVLSYLGNGWGSLDPAQKEDIESFLTPEMTSVAGTLSGCTGLVETDVFDFTGLPGCIHTTPHFAIIYNPGEGDIDPDEDDNPENGLPDFIDTMETSLEGARQAYINMGYEPAPGVVVVLVQGAGEGFASPVGSFIRLGNQAPSATYLARHELFHQVQYNYTALRDIDGYVADFSDFHLPYDETTLWWLEASAEWAAHQASVAIGDPDEPTYARHLDQVFGASRSYLADFPAIFTAGVPFNSVDFTPDRSHAYGSFIFAEYLEEEFDPEFMRRIWEGIDTSDDEVSEVIEGLLVDDESTSIDQVLPEFWIANYLFDDRSGLGGRYHYGDPHLDSVWRDALEDSDLSVGADDFAEIPRPDRTRLVLSTPEVPVTSEVRVAPGGSAFVDLDPKNNLQGDVELTLEIGDSGHLNKYRFSTIAYQRAPNSGVESGLPAVCQRDGESIIETYESELASFGDQVRIDGACQSATLVITNIDLNSDDRNGDEFTVTASFENTSPLTDVVSANSLGVLGNDTSTHGALSSDGTAAVFASTAPNMVTGDQGSGAEIYQHRLVDPGGRETVLVSGGDPDGTTDPDDSSGYPVASSDGELVAFASLDEDLDDTGLPSDGAQIYIAQPGAPASIERVSLFEPESTQLAAAGRPAISGDGRYVVYEAGAYAGLDRPATFASGAVSAIYLHDRDHPLWPPTCLSCDVNGVPVGLSFDPDITDDGDYVVFSTDAALVTTDTNSVVDVYEYNTVHNTLTRVSTDAIGGESLVASTSPEVGGYTTNDAVAYQQGDDVVVHYQGNRYVHDDVNLVELAPGGIGGMVVRSGGDLYHLWPIDTSHAPVLVSAGIDGPANAPAWGGSLDYYGRLVVFNTDADNLLIADTNDTTDVFLRYFDVNNPS